MAVFQKTIAIDFDGCITSKDTKSKNNIPAPRKNAAKVIRRLHNDGYIIIINTLRDDGYKPIGSWEMAAREYLAKYEIPFHYFNANAPERINEYYDSRKIAADIYIDDKNLGGIFKDFEDIYIVIKAQIGLPYKINSNGGYSDSQKPLQADLKASNMEREDPFYQGRFSQDFIKAAWKCPIANKIYNSLYSGESNEYAVIEELYGLLMKATDNNIENMQGNIMPIISPN